MAKTLDEICDLCWDDSQQSVPAYDMVSGVPMCLNCINKTKTTQSRFEQPTPEPRYEVFVPPQKAAPPKQEKVKPKPMPTPQSVVVPQVMSKSSAIAAKGINTGYDLAQFMSAVMTDLIDGKIEPTVATATCAAADRLLKVVEMQIKYGKEERGVKILKLVGDNGKDK